jgi:hypothetical protein
LPVLTYSSFRSLRARVDDACIRDPGILDSHIALSISAAAAVRARGTRCGVDAALGEWHVEWRFDVCRNSRLAGPQELVSRQPLTLAEAVCRTGMIHADAHAATSGAE